VVAIEGPYKVTSVAVAGAGAYYLKDLEEKVVPCSWNVTNLKKYFSICMSFP